MIIYRQIGRPVPSNWPAGVHWYVEYHDDIFDCPFPLGIAFVSYHPNGPLPAIVYFVLVADLHRRKGVATKLIAAIRSRWPDAMLTDAISEDGKAFMDSLCKPTGARLSGAVAGSGQGCGCSGGGGQPLAQN